MSAEALNRKRRFSLSRESRKPFANETQLERWDRTVSPQHQRQQPVPGQSRDQRTIDSSRCTSACNWVEHVTSECLRTRQQFPLRVGEMRVRRIHGTTAMPMSSTFAAGSSSSRTPITAMAG